MTAMTPKEWELLAELLEKAKNETKSYQQKVESKITKK